MKTLVEFAADYISNQANRLYEARKPEPKNKRDWREGVQDEDDVNGEARYIDKNHIVHHSYIERHGTRFLYRHGDTYGKSYHLDGEPKAMIKARVTESNPHLTPAQINKTTNTIHKYITSGGLKDSGWHVNDKDAKLPKQFKHLKESNLELTEAYKPGSHEHFMHHGTQAMKYAREALKIEDKPGNNNHASDSAWNKSTKHLNTIYDHYGETAANNIQDDFDDQHDDNTIQKLVHRTWKNGR